CVSATGVVCSLSLLSSPIASFNTDRCLNFPEQSDCLPDFYSSRKSARAGQNLDSTHAIMRATRLPHNTSSDGMSHQTGGDDQRACSWGKLPTARRSDHACAHQTVESESRGQEPVLQAKNQQTDHTRHATNQGVGKARNAVRPGNAYVPIRDHNAGNDGPDRILSPRPRKTTQRINVPKSTLVGSRRPWA